MRILVDFPTIIADIAEVLFNWILFDKLVNLCVNLNAIQTSANAVHFIFILISEENNF